MFECVNNLAISNCCIISAHVGSHTNTHALTHKKLHSWGVGTQCPSVSVRVSVCVCSAPLLQEQPPPLLASDASLLVFFSLACCKSADDGLARVWTRGSLPVRQSHTSLLPQRPALGLPMASYSIQFSFTVHIVLIHENFKILIQSKE